VEWVQVGNETTGGMLWPMGNVDKNMGNYAVLTQSGYDAVKSVYPEAQIIVHLDRGNLLDIYTRIFNGLKLNNAKWDMIGMSFYPDAGDWQNQTDALTDNIITLNDENGNEVEFEFLDLIPYRQNEYVVLLPIGDSDGQVVILQLKEIDDETEEYVGVENEFVLETVFALFKERNKDFFTFE